MKTKFYLLIYLILVSVFLTACGSQTAENSAPENKAALTEALRASGAKVETGDLIEQPFFSVKGQIFQINGADVQVFEYESVEAAEAEAELVSESGSTIGTSMVSWMAAPHFYKSGRVIVIYVGDDASVVSLLQGALGDQFAGQ